MCAAKCFVEACHLGFSSALQASKNKELKICDLMTVTPEAAGSSPVDPAILRSSPASYGLQAKRAHRHVTSHESVPINAGSVESLSRTCARHESWRCGFKQAGIA